MVTEPRHSAKRRKEKENGPSRKKEKNGRLSELTHGAAKGGTEGGRRAGGQEGRRGNKLHICQQVASFVRAERKAFEREKEALKREAARTTDHDNAERERETAAPGH